MLYFIIINVMDYQVKMFVLCNVQQPIWPLLAKKVMHGK